MNNVRDTIIAILLGVVIGTLPTALSKARVHHDDGPRMSGPIRHLDLNIPSDPLPLMAPVSDARKI